MGFIIEFGMQSSEKKAEHEAARGRKWVPVWFPEHPRAFGSFGEAHGFAQEHYKRVGGPSAGWRVREEGEVEEKR